MRWITQFDGYSYRLLAPGSFLLFVAIIFFIQERGSKEFFNVFKGFLLFFAILSFLLNVPYKAWRSSTLNPTYYANIASLKDKYEDVESNSIIVFAPTHIGYLYADMQIGAPYSLPYSSHKEKWADFLKRVNPQNKKNVYLSVPNTKLSSESYDPSVIDFVEKFDKNTLIKVQ